MQRIKECYSWLIGKNNTLGKLLTNILNILKGEEKQSNLIKVYLKMAWAKNTEKSLMTIRTQCKNLYPTKLENLIDRYKLLIYTDYKSLIWCKIRDLNKLMNHSGKEVVIKSFQSKQAQGQMVSVKQFISFKVNKIVS